MRLMLETEKCVDVDSPSRSLVKSGGGGRRASITEREQSTTRDLGAGREVTWQNAAAV